MYMYCWGLLVHLNKKPLHACWLYGEAGQIHRKAVVRNKGNGEFYLFRKSVENQLILANTFLSKGLWKLSVSSEKLQCPRVLAPPVRRTHSRAVCFLPLAQSSARDLGKMWLLLLVGDPWALSVPSHPLQALLASHGCVGSGCPYWQDGYAVVLSSQLSWARPHCSLLHLHLQQHVPLF